MTFDLYLRGKEIPLDAIFNHIDENADFQRQKIPNENSGYSFLNPVTGVYWYLRIEERGKNDLNVKLLSFSLNYNRATFFALETLPLVENLCRHFDLLVEDPQEDSVGQASFEELLKSWRLHNKRAVQALQADGIALHYMLESKATEWWAFMRERSRIAAHFQDRVFIPQVFLLKRPSGAPFRMIVWDHGNCQLLAPADLVWIDRSKISSHEGKTEQGFVPFERFHELVAPYTTEYHTGTHSYRLLDPAKHPEVISLVGEWELAPTLKHEQVFTDGFHDVEMDKV